jgi:hypothetical protein
VINNSKLEIPLVEGLSEMISVLPTAMFAQIYGT